MPTSQPLTSPAVSHMPNAGISAIRCSPVIRLTQTHEPCQVWFVARETPMENGPI